MIKRAGMLGNECRIFFRCGNISGTSKVFFLQCVFLLLHLLLTVSPPPSRVEHVGRQNFGNASGMVSSQDLT